MPFEASCGEKSPTQNSFPRSSLSLTFALSRSSRRAQATPKHCAFPIRSPIYFLGMGRDCWPNDTASVERSLTQNHSPRFQAPTASSRGRSWRRGAVTKTGQRHAVGQSILGLEIHGSTCCNSVPGSTKNEASGTTTSPPHGKKTLWLPCQITNHKMQRACKRLFLRHF
jgi:hypothetical protein